MQTNLNRDWLLTKAKEEENGFISVGGLVCRVMAAETKSFREIYESARRVALSEIETVRSQRGPDGLNAKRRAL